MDRYASITEHSQSNYGTPVLVDTETGQAYGQGDMLPDGTPAAVVYEELEAEALPANIIIQGLTTIAQEEGFPWDGWEEFSG